MRIYLAGKITEHGLFKKFRMARNKDMFTQKTYELTRLGHIVYNPPALEPPKQNWFTYLVHDILNGLIDFKPDAAYFMRNWRTSPGAQLEHEWCEQNGIRIIYEANSD